MYISVYENDINPSSRTVVNILTQRLTKQSSQVARDGQHGMVREIGGEGKVGREVLGLRRGNEWLVGRGKNGRGIKCPLPPVAPPLSGTGNRVSGWAHENYPRPHQFS